MIEKPAEADFAIDELRAQALERSIELDDHRIGPVDMMEWTAADLIDRYSSALAKISAGAADPQKIAADALLWR
jgi:hypothetical protein